MIRLMLRGGTPKFDVSQRAIIKGSSIDIPLITHVTTDGCGGRRWQLHKEFQNISMHGHKNVDYVARRFRFSR